MTKRVMKAFLRGRLEPSKRPRGTKLCENAHQGGGRPASNTLRRAPAWHMQGQSEAYVAAAGRAGGHEQLPRQPAEDRAELHSPLHLGAMQLKLSDLFQINATDY